MILYWLKTGSLKDWKSGELPVYVAILTTFRYIQKLNENK